MKWACHFYAGLEWWVLNIKINEKRVTDEKVFKKWLGQDFKLEFESNYSVLLSNHLSLYEIVYNTYKYATGFVSKKELRNVPFVGYIADKLETLWLDRTDNNSRSNVFNAIKKRQTETIDKTILTPLLIFPEGTTTSGKHILKFKRGAFDSLLPVKCSLFKSLKHEIAESIINTEIQMLVDFSKLKHEFCVLELPVIYPTEFMYENYKKLNPEITDKVEIFAEVVREIWCEVGGFIKSDKSYSDYLDFMYLVKGKKSDYNSKLDKSSDFSKQNDIAKTTETNDNSVDIKKVE